MHFKTSTPVFTRMLTADSIAKECSEVKSEQLTCQLATTVRSVGTVIGTRIPFKRLNRRYDTLRFSVYRFIGFSFFRFERKSSTNLDCAFVRIQNVMCLHNCDLHRDSYGASWRRSFAEQTITIVREREELLSNYDRNPRWYDVRNLSQ